MGCARLIRCRKRPSSRVLARIGRDQDLRQVAVHQVGLIQWPTSVEACCAPVPVAGRVAEVVAVVIAGRHEPRPFRNLHQAEKLVELGVARHVECVTEVNDRAPGPVALDHPAHEIAPVQVQLWRANCRPHELVEKGLLI